MFRKERGFIPHLKKGAGFTLIELLIVIAVIGILAAAILPRFIAFDTDAMFAADKGSLSSMRAALVLYRAKTGTYPYEGGVTVLTEAVGSGPYIEKLPILQLTTYGAGTSGGKTAVVGITVTGTTGGWIFLSDTGTVAVNSTGDATTW